MPVALRLVAGTLTVGLALSLAVLAGFGDASGSSRAAARPQAATIALTPPIVQRGRRTASADDADLSGTLRFRPAREGRRVVVQRRAAGSAWTEVAALRQDSQGEVRFTGPARAGADWYEYRGVAKRHRRLTRVATAPQSAQRWNTVFDDGFEGNALSDQWSVRAQGVYSPGSQRACSASHPDAVSVGNGRVRLSVLDDPERLDALGPCDASHGNEYDDHDSWYRNGHISTQRRFSFRHGVAAARVRFDRERGAHGAFWLQTTQSDRNGVGPDQDGAEIDVVEYFGKKFREGDVYSFIHYVEADGSGVKVPDGPLTSARAALTRKDNWFKRYHVFSVEWTPTAYVFRVDGIETLRLEEGVSQVPEFLILSMLSSDWELGAMDRETLPNHTDVDWVRVWQE